MNWTSKALTAAIAAAAVSAPGWACPPAKIVKDTDRLTLTDASGAEFEARITDAQIECTRSGGAMKATVRFKLTTASGAPVRTEVPYFVAVAYTGDGAATFVSKDIKTHAVATAGGHAEVSADMVHEGVAIPINGQVLSREFQVLVGFQLSKEQLAKVRKDKSWFGWMF